MVFPALPDLIESGGDLESGLPERRAPYLNTAKIRRREGLLTGGRKTRGIGKKVMTVPQNALAPMEVDGRLTGRRAAVSTAPRRKGAVS